MARCLLPMCLLMAVGCDDTAEASPDAFSAERTRMVQRQLRARDITDAAVLAAMGKVPRHLFVPADAVASAYGDYPLPIGHAQTISQPYIVALMTQLAAVGKGQRVLEVGTGSGYQAAVLAELGAEVFSIEIVEPLARQARATLAQLGYRVTSKHGDGYAGWPQHAPFDAVVITAAPPRIPEPLKQQLKVGGRLVVPVGTLHQSLLVMTRTKTGFTREKVADVRFVPMTGKAQHSHPR